MRGIAKRSGWHCGNKRPKCRCNKGPGLVRGDTSREGGDVRNDCWSWMYPQFIHTKQTVFKDQKGNLINRIWTQGNLINHIWKCVSCIYTLPGLVFFVAFFSDFSQVQCVGRSAWILQMLSPWFCCDALHPKLGNCQRVSLQWPWCIKPATLVILSERLIIICCFVAYVSVGPLMPGPFCLEMGDLEKVADVPEHLLVSQKI